MVGGKTINPVDGNVQNKIKIPGNGTYIYLSIYLSVYVSIH